MNSVLRLVSAAALLGGAAPTMAAVFLVNPAYGPNTNGTYTQISQGTGTYGVELRGGNGATNGDWEIGVGSRTSVSGFFTQGQINWGCGPSGPDGCGTVFDFVLTWKPASTPETTSTLSISLTPQGVTNPTTVTTVTPLGQGYAPLAGDTLRIWAKRDASFTVSEVDGRAFNISRTGVASGAPTATSDVYFYSNNNWGLDGLVAKGTLRIKGGNSSAREIFFANGDFTQTGPLPEPGNWVMLITGFGLTGATLRRRRAAAA